ncbi:MAG: hypothetical protein IKW28_06545 [Lachnospiraceae bacterium]|nr:hypothetical protein [Lachnospiraceae bacterium]
MAKIREFTPKKESSKRGIEFEQKIKVHRRGRVFKILAAAVISVAIIYGIYYYTSNASYSYYNEVSSFPRVSSSDSVCLNHNGRVLTYSKDGISSMDAKGNTIWNETYQMQNPIVEVNENAVAVGDYNGHIIYVMNEKGKVGEVDTNLPIRDFCISKTGNVAVVLEDNKATKLNVYDGKGKLLVESESYMDQNGYPVAVALSEGGEVMEVSYLHVDSGQVKSSVAFYNFSAVGQNSIDRLVSGNEYSEHIIPYVGFFKDGGAFAVGNGRICFYSGEEKPVSLAEKLISEEIQSVYRGDNHIIPVYIDTTGAALYRIDVYDKKGNIILTKTIDIEIHDIIVHNNNIILYNDTECIMLGMSGKEKYRGSFGKSVSLLIPTNKINSFLMVSPTSVDVIELM